MKNQNAIIKNLKKGSIILLFVVAFSACSSSDDAIETAELSEKVMQEFAAEIQKLTVPDGMANSNNAYAMQANASFNALKGLAGAFTGFFTVPGFAVSSVSSSNGLAARSANSTGTRTYTWSQNGESVTYTITEESDRYSFTYTIISADFNGKIMDGYQLKDGSYAEVKIYDDNTVISTIKWTVNGEITTIELESDDVKYILESNTANNSGNLKLYESGTIIISFVWASDGSGSYTNHETNETFTW